MALTLLGVALVKCVVKQRLQGVLPVAGRIRLVQRKRGAVHQRRVRQVQRLRMRQDALLVNRAALPQMEEAEDHATCRNARQLLVNRAQTIRHAPPSANPTTGHLASITIANRLAGEKERRVWVLKTPGLSRAGEVAITQTPQRTKQKFAHCAIFSSS